jgi:hypothetical protein
MPRDARRPKRPEARPNQTRCSNFPFSRPEQLALYRNATAATMSPISPATAGPRRTAALAFVCIAGGGASLVLIGTAVTVSSVSVSHGVVSGMEVSSVVSRSVVQDVEVGVEVSVSVSVAQDVELGAGE